MEHAGAGAGEAAAGRRAVPPARRSLRHRTAAAFRPGQMVSRRAASALGARPATGGGTASRSGATPISMRWNRSLRAPRPETAHRFALAFAQRLQLDPNYLFGAFEDTWYYLWRERRLPSNVTIDTAKVRDPMERERLARVFEQGLDTSVGYVLPVSRDHGREHNGKAQNGHGGRWRSGPWFLRSEKCYLIPGDSPIGYRLPLDSLPWTAPADVEFIAEPDPMAPHPDLPPLEAFRRAPVLRRQERGPSARDQRRRRSAPGSVAARAGARPCRQAGKRHICHRHRAQRHGLRAARRPSLRLHAADGTHRGLSRSRHRGRGHRRGTRPAGVHRRLCAARQRSPPAQFQRDARSRRHRGQHPSLGELARARGQDRDRLRGSAHDAARRARNSCSTAATPAPAAATMSTLGGPSAADSPLLRRPDLLKSLLGYWHNHPSLSYLFSGLFIGPTSQHPRVDEARNDALYELEIAFRQIAPGRPDAALAGRPHLPQPAGRRDRQHAPHRVLHRQAVHARHAPPAGAGCWSCAPSRCRRMRA